MLHRASSRAIDRIGRARRRLRGSIVGLISLGLTGLFGCVSDPGVGIDSTAAAIDEAETRFRTAISGDPAALETLLADDFFYLTAEGTTLDKRGLIDHLRSGKTRIDRIVKEDGQQVRRDGLVVTTGHSVVEVRLDGRATRIRSRHLHVWIEDGGGWRLLARQADMKRLGSD